MTDLASRTWTLILIPLYFGILCIAVVVFGCVMVYGMLTEKDNPNG